MAAIVPRTMQRKSEKGVAILGVGLCDAREEAFVLMVCDGIALGVAFQRAGFKSTTKDAPSKLFELDRIQKRANEIMEARRTTNVVTLSEVTDMLHRVFVGAWHKEEYSAAHNAAFSLARLYGHVTDKATVEVIRRPSRDPDAPSEQALESWVNSLPIINHEPIPEGEIAPEPEPEGQLAAPRRAPAELLGNAAVSSPTAAVSSPTAPVSSPTAAVSSPTAPVSSPTAADDLAPAASSLASVSSGLGPATSADSLATPADSAANASHSHLAQAEKPNDFNGLDNCSRSVQSWQAGGRSENGAPTAAVTGTPAPRARTGLLGDKGTTPVRGSKKGTPAPSGQVPVPKNGRIKRYRGGKSEKLDNLARAEYPPIEDLF